MHWPARRISDVVGYSRTRRHRRNRTLARLRAVRSDLIVPSISVHHRPTSSSAPAMAQRHRVSQLRRRGALRNQVQHAMVGRNAGVALDKRIEFRIGIHLGDVVEESDGDLMGDGVNIAARLERIAAGRDLPFRGRVSSGEGPARSRGHRSRPDSTQNIAEPIRVYWLRVGVSAQAKPAMPTGPPAPKKRSALMPLAASRSPALLILIGGGASVVPQCEPARTVSFQGTGRNSATLHCCHTLRQFVRRSGAGCTSRQHVNRRTHYRSRSHPATALSSAPVRACLQGKAGRRQRRSARTGTPSAPIRGQLFTAVVVNRHLLGAETRDSTPNTRVTYRTCDEGCIDRRLRCCGPSFATNEGDIYDAHG